MTAPGLQGIAAVTAALTANTVTAASAPAAVAPAGAGFGSMVVQGLEQVNRQLVTSQVDLQQLAMGQVENLHQVMIRLEETRLSFQLAMQVRNRLLESYQDLMKMPV